MSARVEHYLKRLLENPDQWVRVTKRKSQESKEANFRERQEVIRDLKTSLNLLGIRYDQQDSTKFRVWSDEAIKADVIDKTLAPYMMGVDYAAKMTKLAINRPEAFGAICYGRRSGKSYLIKELIKFKEYKALEDDRPDSTIHSVHRPPTKD